MSKTTSILTIFSQNELAEVRTLFNSLSRVDTDFTLTALLLEREEHTYIDTKSEQFQITTISEFFGSNHVRKLAELYGILWAKEDFRRAIQPFAIEEALKSSQTVLYVDPSTYFLNSFRPLFAQLADKGGEVGLVPSFEGGRYTDAANFALKPNFVLSLVAATQGASSESFFNKWRYFSSKLFGSSPIFLNNAAHTNEKVQLLTGINANLGSWITQPSLIRRSDTGVWSFADQPITSFTFPSNFKFDSDQSPHSHKDIHQLYKEYFNDLLANQYLELRQLPYSRNQSHSGLPLSPQVRACLRHYLSDFNSSYDDDDIIRYVFTPQQRAQGFTVPPIIRFVYESRADLRKAFPNPLKDDDLINWFNTYGCVEMGATEIWDHYKRNVSSETRRNDVHSAMQQIANRDDLRKAMSTAFVTAEGNERLKQWIQLHGAKEYGWPPTVVAQLGEALDEPCGSAVHLYFQNHTYLQGAHPLGLTAVQSEELAAAISDLGIKHHNIAPLWIQYFRLAVGRDWTHDVKESWIRNRRLQELFPLGLTAFGYREFLEYLYKHASQIKPEGNWSAIKKLDLSLITTPLSQLRTFYSTENELQKRFPGAFDNLSSESLTNLVDYLHANRGRWHLSSRWFTTLQAEIARFDEQLRVAYIGLNSGFTGLSVAARSHLKALKSAGADVNSFSLGVGQKTSNNEIGIDSLAAGKLRHFNIFHCNDDIFLEATQQIGKKNLEGRINIAYAVWELETYVPKLPWHQYVSEIWTPSQYSASAIASAVSVPVQVMPHPVQAPTEFADARTRFKIPKDAFVYFFMTDAKSRLKRKNVPGIVRAFRESYRKSESNCLLLLKISDPQIEAENVEELMKLCEGLPVQFIFETVSQAELNGLLKDCNCYVSLHRSEGFGLTLAEAMSIGQPVIATDYSGNLEYMNINNSFPVRYEIREEEEFDDFFGKCPWAFANESHAAELMTFVRNNPEKSKAIGEAARRHIATNFSSEKIGKRMHERLELLLRNNKNTEALLEIEAPGYLKKAVNYL